MYIYPSEPYDGRKKCFYNCRSRTTVTKNVFITVGAVRRPQKNVFVTVGAVRRSQKMFL